MGNQQESLQFKLFMEDLDLGSLILHKKEYQTDIEKMNFIKSYLFMSAPEQLEYLEIGRGKASKMRQRLVAHISSLPNPQGFVDVDINSTIKYLVNREGTVIRKNDRIIVKPMLDPAGYYRVSITHIKPNGTIADYERTHRVVASAFLPNPENKQTVNHIDGNKLNNNVINLEWATYSENTVHAIDTGLANQEYKKLARPYRRKLTEEQAQLVKPSSLSHAALAREFGVSESTIANTRKL